MPNDIAANTTALLGARDRQSLPTVEIKIKEEILLLLRLRLQLKF